MNNINFKKINDFILKPRNLPYIVAGAIAIAFTYNQIQHSLTAPTELVTNEGKDYVYDKYDEYVRSSLTSGRLIGSHAEALADGSSITQYNDEIFIILKNDEAKNGSGFSYAVITIEYNSDRSKVQNLLMCSNDGEETKEGIKAVVTAAVQNEILDDNLLRNFVLAK